MGKRIFTNMNILEEADKIIHGDRNMDYGHPLENHGFTAALWNVYLTEMTKRGKSIGPEEVCWMNILQKISRQMFKNKRDNLTDVAGYAGNIEMINDKLNTNN